MKLYYARGASSIGIHVILEEVGKPYERAEVALMEGEQYQAPFLEISPKSKVPVLLRDDGSVLTEYGAIARWLALTNPAADLLPGDTEGEVRMIEAIDFCVGTIHMQGYLRAFVPQMFAPDKADYEAVRKRGLSIMKKGFAILESALAGKDYIAGRYSIGDSAVFYVTLWGRKFDLALAPDLARHFERMLERPAVRRALAAEGLDPAGNKV